MDLIAAKKPVIPPKGIKDRSGLELFHAGHKELVRKNLDARAQAVLDQFNGVSDCSVSDIILALAKYGGRVEVAGFGTFFVRERPGKWKNVRGPKPDYVKNTGKPDPRRRWQPGRFWIEFRMDFRLRDLLHEDYFGDDPTNTGKARRNMSVFVEKRNLLL